MTLFDYVNDEKLAVFRACGFNWDEHRYINIFRWIWNEKHYHPQIQSFPGEISNKAFCLLEKPNINSNSYKFVADSYDDAIIKIVDYIAEHYLEYLAA